MQESGGRSSDGQRKDVLVSDGAFPEILTMEARNLARRGLVNASSRTGWYRDIPPEGPVLGRTVAVDETVMIESAEGERGGQFARGKERRCPT